MATLSQSAAHAAAAPAAIGPAVIVVIVLIVVWRFVVYKDGKGTPAGRLVACLLAMIVGWTLLAVGDPQAAQSLASGTAAGVVTLLNAAASLLGRR